MILKPVDDKQSQKSTLLMLMNHPAADATTKKRIEQEIRNIQAGIRGEEEAAYEMKVHYGSSPNWMVIHDLRITHNGLVAQIDHLIMNRLLEIWVCESKHFSEGIAINEYGEFAAFSGNKPYGVPSPIEQNNRHILILQRLFDSGAVNLPKRLGFTIKPELKSLILVSKGARISRPKKQIPGLDAIIKNDMLAKKINETGDEASVFRITKAIGADTLANLAWDIASLHEPIQIDWAAKFGLTHQQTGQTTPKIAQGTLRLALPVKTKPVKQPAEQAAVQPINQKMICHSCSVSVPYNVAKFCWFNKPKFGGNLYCMDCQKSVSPV